MVIFDRCDTEHETHRNIDPTMLGEFHFLSDYVHLDSTLNSFALDGLANSEAERIHFPPLNPLARRPKLIDIMEGDVRGTKRPDDK